MKYTKISIVESSESIAHYYQTIYKAIGGSSETDELWLIKQPGWIAVCAQEETFYSENLIKLQKYGYSEITALSWSDCSPLAIDIPLTPEAISEFFMKKVLWYVLYAGQPDWLILLANTLDLWLVAGPPELVHTILGCSPEQAFRSLEEFAHESKYVTLRGQQYYDYLLYQLRSIYPSAQVGTVINLGLPG